MNRYQMKRDMIAENDGKIMVSTTRASQILGISRTTLAKMLEGVDYMVGGKNHAKMFLVSDVIRLYCEGRSTK